MSARGVTAGMVALVLVVGGAVVVDRVSAREAHDVVDQQVRSNVPDLVGDPRVEVLGFPFLTQLVAGRLTDVRVHLDGARLDGLTVSAIDLEAHGVGTASPYTVQRALVHATLSFAMARSLIAERTGLDLDLRAAGDALVATATVLGFPVSATLRPRPTVGAVRLELVDVSLAGVAVPVDAMPATLRTALSDLAVPVAKLPAGVELTGTAVVAGGVRVTLTGADVALADLMRSSAG